MMPFADGVILIARFPNATEPPPIS